MLNIMKTPPHVGTWRAMSASGKSLNNNAIFSASHFGGCCKSLNLLLLPL